MKIIADSSADPYNKKYMLEATATEVANFIGFYWNGQEGCPQLTVGMEITVAEMFSQLYRMKRVEDELEKCAVKLREAADLCTVHDPIKVIEKA